MTKIPAKTDESRAQVKVASQYANFETQLTIKQLLEGKGDKDINYDIFLKFCQENVN